MNSSISFVLDGQLVSLDFQDPAGPNPTTTILNYLRSLPSHTGVKEGCAEGDCGACTVVLCDLCGVKPAYYAVDSCLVFLPMIHGKQLITIENLRTADLNLHPVQQAMVETGGSQCGYCTPGITMSLFSLYKTKDHPDRAEIDDCLTGNLCRCTGYKPIIEAAARSCVHKTVDHLTDLEPKTSRLLQSISQGPVHIRTSQQEYWRPATLPEALDLKSKQPAAIVLCGATDLALRVTKKHELLKEIIDVGGLSELRKIEAKPSVFRIGAGVTLSTLMEMAQNELPALFDILMVFGSRQIRNLGTLGGNIGTASPVGDLLPALMAYNARVVLQSSRGSREVALDDYFTGYRETVREPIELIVSVVIPRSQNGAVVKSYKVSKRKDLDISTVSSAFRLELGGGRIVKQMKLAYGGMAERPKRATRTETFLIGKSWQREVVEEAMDVLDEEFTPISDVRSGAAFRKIAARNLLLKFWSETSMK